MRESGRRCVGFFPNGEPLGGNRKVSLGIEQGFLLQALSQILSPANIHVMQERFWK
jgi:hypothetical protein